MIEIKDNGPFFESGLEIKNQSLVLRGAAGFRPLIALNESTTAGGTRFLVSVQQSNLVLENVDLVLKAGEGQQGVETGLVRLCSLPEGNLLLEDWFPFAGRAHA